MTQPEVDVTQSGRGGSIYYREGEHRIAFDWEFALPPTLVMIWGPNAVGWDAGFPWAQGRQEAIYHLVGREVIRQQANGCTYRFDLDAGTMDILRAHSNPRPETRADRSRSSEPSGAGPASRPPTIDHSPAYLRFQDSVVPLWEEWQSGRHYDLEALAEVWPAEREEIVTLLSSRDVTWREVEALDRIDTASARAALQEALGHHLRIDTRLAAAEALRRHDPGFDLETVLARQLRHLNQPTEGLERALRLARTHDSPLIRQALLWASYNATDCAPGCAGLLLQLAGQPVDSEVPGLLTRLGLHNSSTTRGEAFEDLSRRVGMILDPDTGD